MACINFIPLNLVYIYKKMSDVNWAMGQLNEQKTKDESATKEKNKSYEKQWTSASSISVYR